MRCAPSVKSSRIPQFTTVVSGGKKMALKPPPPPWEVLQQISDMVGGSGIKGEMDKSVRSLASSALSRLEMVSREEFDAQAEILQRTSSRVVALEAELEELTTQLDTLSRED